MFGCCLRVLFCRLKIRKGVEILTLCLFVIKCACVISWAFICICTIFYVIYSRVCVYHGIRTISKMLYICYHQGSIVLTVCAASFYFQHIMLSLQVFGGNLQSNRGGRGGKHIEFGGVQISWADFGTVIIL